MKKPQKLFKSVAMYCHHKPSKEAEETAFLSELIAFLESRNIKKIHGDLRVTSLLDNAIPPIQDENFYDLKIAVGGDGTLLKMMRTLQKKDGLFLGINFGTLGFLSELTPDNALDALEDILKGNFYTDERRLLKTFVYRENQQGVREKIFRAYALNEVVFGHGGLARLTNFYIKSGRRTLSTYRCDGLIIATPTGSTAYSMSANGPIVAPSVPGIVITPVAPHTLTHRSIILPNKEILHLNFESRTEAVTMTVDGQIHFSLRSSDQVSVQRATRTAKFIRLSRAHYFKTLRKKLGWGE